MFYFDTEYQYQLEGLYSEWSDWTTDATISFKNLPFGDYVFNIRARVGNSMTNNTASYSFTIGRPWYLSNISIAIYVLAVFLFSVFMHNVYKRYYRKQRENY